MASSADSIAFLMCSVRGCFHRVAVGGFLAALVMLQWDPPASACFIKSHHWRIVLGESAAGVVILDLPLHTEEKMVRCKLGESGCSRDVFAEESRGSNGFGERLSVTWKGPAQLVAFAQNGQPLRTLVRLPPIRHNALQEASMPKITLGRALTAAARLPGFRAYPLPSQDFCDYNRRCGRFELVSDDKGNLSVSVDNGVTGKVAYTVVLPQAFIERLADGDALADAGATLRILTVLSYPNAQGELLVLDIGAGDEMNGAGAPAIYPPCGCMDIRRCPPWPETLHHGDQVQVLVQLPEPAPARASLEKPPARSLTAEDLLRARSQPTWPPRSDGIYVSAPTCWVGQDWTRTAVRFLRRGRVAVVSGNYSPADSARIIAQYGVRRSPKPCETHGAALTCSLNEPTDDDDEPPSITLEGRWDAGWLDARLTRKKDALNDFHSLRFVPLDEDILSELDSRDTP